MANKFLTAIGALASLIAPSLANSYTVTDGVVTFIDNKFYTEDTATRMEFPRTDGDSLVVSAKYIGKTLKTEALASGVIQEQFGIKLRAANTCNLVYVMRRFSPHSSVTIMYKQNIGMSTHEQCGDKGYAIIKDIPVPSVISGTIVKLAAKFDNTFLTVTLDDKLIWSGIVDFKQTGVAGFRSDNVKVSFTVSK